MDEARASELVINVDRSAAARTSSGWDVGIRRRRTSAESKGCQRWSASSGDRLFDSTRAAEDGDTDPRRGGSDAPVLRLKSEEAIRLPNIAAEILGDRAVGVVATGAAGGVSVVRSRPADERRQFRLVLVDRMVPRHKHGLGGGGAAHRKPHEQEEGRRGDDCTPLPRLSASLHRALGWE